MDRTGSLRRGTQATHRGVPQRSAGPKPLQLSNSLPITDAGLPDSIAVELKRAVVDGGREQQNGGGREPREVQHDCRGGELLRLGLSLPQETIGAHRRT